MKLTNILYTHAVARVQAHRGKNSWPASKTRYFVLSAFAHERSILIGCLLLDSIIKSVSSNIEAVRALFLGRRGAGIIKNPGRRIIIYASNYYARGGASLYMQVIKGGAHK
jgi:hypothetical protein